MERNMAHRVIGRYMEGARVETTELGEAVTSLGITVDDVQAARAAVSKIRPHLSVSAKTIAATAVLLNGPVGANATRRYGHQEDRPADVYSFIVRPNIRQVVQFCRDTGTPMNEIVSVC